MSVVISKVRVLSADWFATDCLSPLGELEQHYSANYKLNVAKSGEEHVFYSASGATARSRLL